MTATAAASYPVALRMGNRPCIGSAVHYQDRADLDGRPVELCRPVVVVEVHPDGHTVGVCAPADQFVRWLSNGGCQHSEGARRHGSWHWPDSHP